MKKFLIILSFLILSGCSMMSINYDPVEYDRVVSLTLIAEDVAQSCGDRNKLSYQLNNMSINLRYLEKYSKHHTNNSELYSIVAKLQESVNKFKAEVNKKDINLDYCKLQGEFLTASTERTLEAVAKRR